MNILLVDTGFSSIPLYECLLKAGYKVWVIGNRPDDVIARRAGKNWIMEDYSRVDLVAKYVEKLKIDRLVPGCTDVSMKTCVKIQGEDDQFDTFEAHEILTNKSSFRNFCNDLDLPAPRSVSVDEIPSGGRFICKPVDSFSGNGISTFFSDDCEATRISLSKAKAASTCGEIVVEFFVNGQLYSWSTFIESGKINPGFFVFEGSSVDAFAVDTSFIYYDLPVNVKHTLFEALEKILKCLNLKDGLIHIQFIADGDSVSIVEITRRCPGDLYSKLIEYSTGYNYAGKYVSFFTGEPVAANVSKKHYILRHTLTSEYDLILSGFENISFHSLRAFYPLASSGAKILTGHKARIAIAFYEVLDESGVKDLSCRLLRRSVYNVI